MFYYQTIMVMLSNKTSRHGFTIVELLIVIVVIAILATISIVAYRGIQERARATEVSAGLTQSRNKLELYKVDNGTYPTTGNLASADVKDTDVSYQDTSDGSTYCLTGTVGTASYKASNAESPQQGGCAGHGQGGVAAITNLATNPHAMGGWASQTPAGSTTSYVANGANDGGSTFQVVTTQSGQLRISMPQVVGAVTSGDTIGVSVDIYSPVSTTAQIEIGINSSTYPKSSVFNLSSGWQRVNADVTMSATGSVALVQILGASNSANSGQTWEATKALITKGSHTSGYADGSSANWLWNGTPNNSTSTGPAL